MCVHACMHVHTYVRMYRCTMYVCMHACMYVRTYVCTVITFVLSSITLGFIPKSRTKHPSLVCRPSAVTTPQTMRSMRPSSKAFHSRG